MISSITFKFGRTPQSAAITVETTPITVFVGPNNSGKSKVLTEIEYFCRHGAFHAPPPVIVASISFQATPPQDVARAIEHIKRSPNPDETLGVGQVMVGSRVGRMIVSEADIRRALEDPNQRPTQFAGWYLTHSTLMLDGASRIALVNQQGAGDLQRAADTSFQVLLRSDPKRHEVRRIIYEAFGEYFVLDPTNLGTLRVRLSPRPPANAAEEIGILPPSVEFHSNARPIETSSDGVKAFTGIITELIAGDPRVVLIDEPEAFLHPALATKLGLEVARAATRADKRVFVSTHSPMFVMGCIQSGTPVNIVRLTYRGGAATARILPSTELVELMRHPLLRSTGLLSGLFYEFVVVTESDADRAFYQEVNQRLLEHRPEWGIPNCLFINAQNKQTIHTILRPLRTLGIPAAAIVDIDVVKEGGVNWSNLMSAAGTPEMLSRALGTMRGGVNRAMEDTGRDMKRDGGVAILDGEYRESADALLAQLREYGIFAVPGGELESWLKEFEIPSHGSTWLVAMFERMGEDPAHADYVRPTGYDVWQFLGQVKAWLVDPLRKGIPE